MEYFYSVALALIFIGKLAEHLFHHCAFIIMGLDVSVYHHSLIFGVSQVLSFILRNYSITVMIETWTKKNAWRKRDLRYNQASQSNVILLSVSEPLGGTAHQEQYRKEKCKEKMASFKIYGQEKGRTFPWCISRPFTCQMWLNGFSLSHSSDVLVPFPEETWVTYIS